MAGKKQFVDPLAALGGSDEAFQPVPVRKEKKRFDNPTDGLEAEDVLEATQSKLRAGQYVRMSVTVPPKQRRLLEEISRKEQLSVNAFVRWALDLALDAYEQGERPEVTEVITRGEAVKRHWSSQ